MRTSVSAHSRESERDFVFTVSNQTTASHEMMNRLLPVILPRRSSRCGTISAVGMNGAKFDIFGEGREGECRRGDKERAESSVVRVKRRFVETR